MLIPRARYVERIARGLARSPVVAILGPRQAGKTTLAREVARSVKHTWFDLEDPVSQRRLETPRLALAAAEMLVVMDEVQRMPALFQLLRVMVDTEPERRFLLLGSASPHLVERTSESLAGRVEFVELGSFDMLEVGTDNLQTLWLRGGFPRSYLASNDADSLAWRQNFIRTFLERDLPAFGVKTPAATMRRVWTMLAHSHGQILNSSELSRSLGISDKTIKSYLDVLEGTYVVRLLQPWFENIGKRLVRSPKVYLRDTGLLHALLGMETQQELWGHPKVGASWEGFALEQLLQLCTGEPWFWATHQGAELDLLLLRRRDRVGVEFKRSDAPKLSRSMRSAIESLQLDHLYVVHPGDETYPLSQQVTALPLSEAVTAIA